jgi:hypothetical protein
MEVLVTTVTASSTCSDKDIDSWASTDFSRLDNPGSLRHFIGICDYPLDDDDLDNDGYCNTQNFASFQNR